MIVAMRNNKHKTLERLIDRSEWNQAGVAMLMGVSKAAVSRWVSGKRRPTEYRIANLARLLGSKPHIVARTWEDET